MIRVIDSCDSAEQLLSVQDLPFRFTDVVTGGDSAPLPRDKAKLREALSGAFVSFSVELDPKAYPTRLQSPVIATKVRRIVLDSKTKSEPAVGTRGAGIVLSSGPTFVQLAEFPARALKLVTRAGVALEPRSIVNVTVSVDSSARVCAFLSDAGNNKRS